MIHDNNKSAYFYLKLFFFISFLLQLNIWIVYQIYMQILYKNQNRKYTQAPIHNFRLDIDFIKQFDK